MVNGEDFHARSLVQKHTDEHLDMDLYLDNRRPDRVELQAMALNRLYVQYINGIPIWANSNVVNIVQRSSTLQPQPILGTVTFEQELTVAHLYLKDADILGYDMRKLGLDSKMWHLLNGQRKDLENLLRITEREIHRNSSEFCCNRTINFVHYPVTSIISAPFIPGNDVYNQANSPWFTFVPAADHSFYPDYCRSLSNQRGQGYTI